ncbi:MAG: WYL domain-containing protein [Pseudomonadota bacterium]
MSVVPRQSRQDRLADLVQLLRDGRLHRGADLAQALGVSTRTLYRDMDTLMASGLPVEGERGIGYMMTAPITLPPLNLTLEELEALHSGLSAVRNDGAPTARAAAETLAAKIDAALPEDRSAPANGWGFATYPFADAPRGFAHVAPLRAAVRTRRAIDVTIAGPDDTKETLRLRPLQLEFWGRIWTLTAWCETTEAFRTLRVDRIQTLDVTSIVFDEEPGKTLADHLDAKA